MGFKTKEKFDSGDSDSDEMDCVSEEAITTVNETTLENTDDQSMTNQNTAVQPSSSDYNQNASSTNDGGYAAYLSIIPSVTDVSSEDEELNRAILASIESCNMDRTDGPPAKDVLQGLAVTIDRNKQCRFNINRGSVFDGAMRGFKRLSFNPSHSISVKFSDDMGQDEEAVDLGGPRREFLKLLMEALLLSPIFEGQEHQQNLALDSTALREDRYFIAGLAIAVSLVHGGPSPGFLSPTLFSCLVNGLESANPTLDDIADTELYEKIKTISECSTLHDLLVATEPLRDYLANAGCLRPLRRIEDRDVLVKDIIMFQVIHRLRGPFERFRDGLRTLGVLDAIQKHPGTFLPLLCHAPDPLTARTVEDLFSIRLSPQGSNRRVAEEIVVPFWRDYLEDVEEEGGPAKLGKILAFATGADAIPPIGFSPQPSVEFLHQDAPSTARLLPMANTCINCMKLPLHVSYQAFKESMEFALGNTQGFGRE
ncbi:G2/M phase-specific E3 ubiquitin-protein ligase-like [Chanodichthys erythropterus]|uniref:G2/M phase-specific E3 ubiquitin-protein ligase-like n=1 Tax=Chanodichthys erythropterus TaxID=933992 RepID=UPI00351E3769